MLRRKVFGVLLCTRMLAADASPSARPRRSLRRTEDVIDKIKDEGMNRSQVMQTLSYMSDVIGPRLTASPGHETRQRVDARHAHQMGTCKRASRAVGTVRPRLDAKTFLRHGRRPDRLSADRLSESMVARHRHAVPAAPPVDPKAKKKKTPPQPQRPSTAYTAEVVHFTATKEDELEQYKGKLKGKIVLVGALREIKAHFDAEGKRSTEKDLLDLADAPDPASIRRRPGGTAESGRSATFSRQQQFNARRMRFLAEEGAAILIDAGRGDGGTIFVQQATAVQPPPAAARAHRHRRRSRLYDKTRQYSHPDQRRRRAFQPPRPDGRRRRKCRR